VKSFYVKITAMSERIVFMGSPGFAVPILQALYEDFTVVGAITQPDRPAGRGKALTPPPVKVLAAEFSLPVIQPVRLKDTGVLEQIKGWNPDVIIVAAFGQILRQNVLDLPPFGCINVHASLLPRWRGATPIQAALLAGDNSTGISIMKMDSGIDTGGVFIQEEVRIEGQDTAETLGNRLAERGAHLLVETLPLILQGRKTANLQDEMRATYAPKIEKEEGLLRFLETAAVLERKVRAFHPWPGTFFELDGKMCKVIKVREAKPGSLLPGKTGVLSGLPAIGTLEGDLIIEQLQPAGKKVMNGDVFLHGYRQWDKVFLGK